MQEIEALLREYSYKALMWREQQTQALTQIVVQEQIRIGQKIDMMTTEQNKNKEKKKR